MSTIYFSYTFCLFIFFHCSLGSMKCPVQAKVLISHLEYWHIITEHKIYSLWKKWKQFDFAVKQRLTPHFEHFILVVASKPGFLHLSFLPFSIKTGQWSRPSNRIASVGTRAAGPRLFFCLKLLLNISQRWPSPLCWCWFASSH